MPTLRFSSTGPYVEAAQLALQRAGSSLLSPDGIFGPATQKEVVAFQQKEGLIADGIIGPRTWRRLLPYLRGFVTHLVVRGDSFWRLAKRYQTTVKAIAGANPELSPEALPIGRRLVIPLGFPLVPTNITFASFWLPYIVEGLMARYPFLTQQTAGKSVMGTSLPILTMGEGSRAVCLNAAHHGNEWITTPVVLKFLEEYAKAYAQGESIAGIPARQLYRRTRLTVVPMVNPDGVDLATGTLTAGPYFRQAKNLSANYPDIPFPTGWKANINGIDLNLQYPAGWEQARINKFALGYRTPGPRDYVGSAPLTQPEAIAMADLTRNRDFDLILAYHSQGELIYYRYADYNPPRADAIGQALSEVSGYSLENTPYDSGFAGYKDWFIQEYNRPGYTVEVGKGVNPLPITQFDQIYQDNLPLMATALQLV